MGLGLLFISIDRQPHIAHFLAEKLLSNTEPFYLIGVISIVLSILTLIGVYQIQKGKFLKLKVKPFSAYVDPVIIQHYVCEYVKEVFPEESIGVEVVVVRKHKLELIFDMVGFSIILSVASR